MYAESIVELDPDKVRHNLRELKKKTDAKIFAVIKANAYGLGEDLLAKAVRDEVYAFCVATPAEALNLRRLVDHPILLLGYAGEDIREELIKNNISLAISSFEEALALDKLAARLAMRVGVHLALDTGHSRIGLATEYKGDSHPGWEMDLTNFRTDFASPVNKESISELKKIYSLNNLEIQGIYSHFSMADEEDGLAFTLYQWKRLYNFSLLMEEEGLDPGIRHIANDAGLLVLPRKMQLDAVRLGICLYGHYPSEFIKGRTDVSLEIPYCWSAPVAMTKYIDKGVGVGYGQTWKADRKTGIATVQIGYADGYDRKLSNKGRVIIGGHSCPIVGRVCMDQLMVDITDAGDISPGDRAILLSEDFDADEMAKIIGTISYEVLARIGSRVARKLKKRG